MARSFNNRFHSNTGCVPVLFFSILTPLCQQKYGAPRQWHLQKHRLVYIFGPSQNFAAIEHCESRILVIRFFESARTQCFNTRTASRSSFRAHPLQPRTACTQCPGTILFTDIQSSTHLWATAPEEMAQAPRAAGRTPGGDGGTR